MSAAKLADRAMRVYNMPVSKAQQLDVYGNDLNVPKRERKMRKFIECFAEELQANPDPSPNPDPDPDPGPNADPNPDPNPNPDPDRSPDRSPDRTPRGLLQGVALTLPHRCHDLLVQLLRFVHDVNGLPSSCQRSVSSWMSCICKLPWMSCIHELVCVRTPSYMLLRHVTCHRGTVMPSQHLACSITVIYSCDVLISVS